MRVRLVAAALCGAMALASVRGAHAATCAAPLGATSSFTGVSGRERLLWIADRLDDGAHKAKIWSRAWGWSIAATGVASLAVVPFVSSDQRVDWYVSAGEAAVGVIPFIVAPLEVLDAAPAVRASIAQISLEDDPRVCMVLSDAERRLRDAAANERRNRAWYVHAGNIVFNTGVLLFLGLGWGHWGSGIINGVAGAAVGEGVIFTQPTGAIDAAAAYDRGELTPRAARPSPALTWSFAPTFAF